MGIIKQLPSAVANQIAAGEVIERPASVIKELLENALDAQARHIVIDIEKGGMQLCRVRDDGIGINKEDLVLAVAPHATSKITTVEDLSRLHSLGFRGEALASISSVSLFSITSCAKKQPHAYQLVMKPQYETQIQAAAHPVGTTIEVRELFCTVPVRRTFLKQPKTEFAHIEAVVKKVALSCFDVGFNLSHNGKRVFNLQPAFTYEQQIARIKKLFGSPFCEACLAFDESKGNYRIHGWLARPTYMRSQSDLQYVYINGRMIRDKLVMHAIRQVYEPLLYPGRSAAFLIYIELPPDEVDVNVHPTKHEVRFQEPRSIHNFLSTVIAQHLKASKAEELSTKADALSFNKKQTMELSTQGPLSKVAVAATPYVGSKETNDNDFIIVSEVVGLYLNGAESYLFDVPRLYGLMIEQSLTHEFQQKKQLPSRPLLVPLTVKLTPSVIEYFPVEPLLAYGMNTSQVAEDTLIVRSFPSMSPHLDILGFIRKVSEKVEQDKWLQTLAQSQLVTAPMLTKDERRAVLNFLLNAYQSKAFQSLPCRRLSASEWREIIHG